MNVDVALSLELNIAFTEDMILAYGGSGEHLHASASSAARLGFPALVSWGTLTVLPFTELLTRHAGPRWYVGGSLEVRLTKPVCAGDVVTYSLRATDSRSPLPDVWTLDLTAVSSRSGLVATARATLKTTSVSKNGDH